MKDVEKNSIYSYILTLTDSKIFWYMGLLYLFILIVPIPTISMEIFIVINLLSSLIFFIILLFQKNNYFNLSYNKFIFFSTIFNLILNITATRTILTMGEDYNGKIIPLMFTFIGINNYYLSLIIFFIILSVNIVIITKSCVSVSEVAARFTLDSFQIKQMAIDVEISSGVINQEDADLRKEALKKELDFFDDQDSVSKYISLNEKIRIFIIAISLLFGIIVGKFNGLSINESMQYYYSLIIGNGILSIIPVLLINTAINVTRLVKE